MRKIFIVPLTLAILCFVLAFLTVWRNVLFSPEVAGAFIWTTILMIVITIIITLIILIFDEPKEKFDNNRPIGGAYR